MTEEEKILRKAQGYTIYEHQGKTICLNLENFDKEKFCKDWGFKDVEVFTEKSGNKVLYDPTQYAVDISENEDFLHYRGKSETPTQPIGCTSFYSMFEDWPWLNLDLNHWDTSKVTKISYMFYNACFLKELKVDTWDTRNIKEVNSVFRHCAQLESIDLSKWVLNQVKDFELMFSDCNSLKYLDLNNFGMQSASSLCDMFQSCYSLERIELDKWDVNQVKHMEDTFYDCIKLTDVDFSKWIVNSDVDFGSVFYGCDELVAKYNCKRPLDLAQKLIKRIDTKTMYIF